MKTMPVKVWDLENSLNLNKKDDGNLAVNASTWNSTTKSELSTNSASSSETERSG
jgi:hypothetical protein